MLFTYPIILFIVIHYFYKKISQFGSIKEKSPLIKIEWVLK